MTVDIPEDAPYAPRPRTTRVRHVSEEEIKAGVLDYLRGLDASYARKVHGGAMGNTGEPDIDACVRGRAVKLEGKRPGKRPDPAQLGALRRWQAAGALVGWFTSTAHVRELLAHVADSGYVTDLTHAGCQCGAHLQVVRD
jgi:hypothetical protein